MKKTYITPTLNVHGSVVEITQAFGNSSARDTAYIGQAVFGHGTGSRDGDVVPRT